LHPDKNDSVDAVTQFRDLKEAYNYLSDPLKKEQYDYYKKDDPFAESKYKPYNYVHPYGSTSTIYKTNLTLEEAYNGVSLHVNGSNIFIPAGVQTGNKLSIGNNTYLQVNVTPHGLFKRSGADLLVDVSISAFEAMLGIDAHLSNLDGNTIKFRIPDGTQPGQIIRLARKGMVNTSNNVKGDILVRCNVFIPSVLTEPQKLAILNFNNRNVISI